MAAGNTEFHDGRRGRVNEPGTCGESRQDRGDGEKGLLIDRRRGGVPVS